METKQKRRRRIYSHKNEQQKLVPGNTGRPWNILKEPAVAEYRRLCLKPGETDITKITPVACKQGGVLVVCEFPDGRVDKVLFSANGRAYRNKEAFMHHNLTFQLPQ